MPLLPALLPAFILALTEPLPLSATAHLSLIELLTGRPGLEGIDLFAALLGMLLATACYFAPDIWRLLVGLVQFIRGRQRAEGRLLGHLLLASLPAALLLIADPELLAYSGAAAIVGATSLAGGLMLLLADRLAMTIRRIEHMRASDALLFGFFQLLAILPGASRTGATMTAGRVLGLERGEAARFALLMSLPSLLGISGLVGYDLLERDLLVFEATTLSVGVLTFLVTLAAIASLFRWLKRRSFMAFAIYRILLGLLLLAWAYQPWRR